jgi:hypothetical protein
MAAERPFVICQLGGDKSEDTKNSLRLQFLTSRVGLSAGRAELIAALAWPIGGAA